MRIRLLSAEHYDELCSDELFKEMLESQVLPVAMAEAQVPTNIFFGTIKHMFL